MPKKKFVLNEIKPKAREPKVKEKPDTLLKDITTLLLALEDTLIGSSPNPDQIRELYVKLKEATCQDG